MLYEERVIQEWVQALLPRLKQLDNGELDSFKNLAQLELTVVTNPYDLVHMRVRIHAAQIELERREFRHVRGFLLDIFLSLDLATEVKANFQHQYETVWLPTHGLGKARLIFHAQEVRVIVAQIWDKLIHLLEVIGKFYK